MTLRRFVKFLFFTVVLNISLFGQNPFKVDISKNSGNLISVHFSIPKGYYLYQKSLKISSNPPDILALIKEPEPHKKFDSLENKNINVYSGDNVVFRYKIIKEMPSNAFLIVDYQGCNDSMCFMPQTDKINLKTQNIRKEVSVNVSNIKEDSSSANSDFVVVGRIEGYQNVDKFLSFLNNVKSGKVQDENTALSKLKSHGAIFMIIIILLGGLALNLTPCVLPMIPINLAIIGAGVQSKSKIKGALLGLVYGLGMAFAYGLLGVIVVITGSRFGMLQSSPIFNFIIATIFVILALGMFGVINIDLSRFQSGIKTGNNNKASITLAFVLGAFSAILAGSCVAPVLISVLLISRDVYANGNLLGLFLPFLLGIGMALPWPLAGSGLSLLPKPGAWMVKIKYAFGVIVLIFALYYAYLGYSIINISSDIPTDEGWLTSIEQAKAIAEKENKLVFVDFWATWCKSCHAMDAKTFKDANVKKALDAFIKVKITANNMKSPDVLPLLDKYNVQGLPTYIVLKKK